MNHGLFLEISRSKTSRAGMQTMYIALCKLEYVWLIMRGQILWSKVVGIMKTVIHWENKDNIYKLGYFYELKHINFISYWLCLPEPLFTSSIIQHYQCSLAFQLFYWWAEQVLWFIKSLKRYFREWLGLLFLTNVTFPMHIKEPLIFLLFKMYCKTSYIFKNISF